MINRLAQAASLYLRKHAENPIDWWPWCDQALAKAQAEDKPIFLSIGYSSCHWCTVMEGEAFSDGAIAQFLNEHYIAIKVDREERPDLDSIYMQALQMMVGQGGWPLNLFLTPEQRIPFYSGTYFPLEPRYGRPGFLQILQALHRLYHQDKAKLNTITQELSEALRQEASLAPGTLDPTLLPQGLGVSARIIQSRGQAGGQAGGQGNRFPMMPYAQAALHRLRWPEGAEPVRQACKQRGLDLALGGIFDAVAGGFHRYTVDSTWTVPHFEKMLYDNGQILEYLAHLWQAGLQEPAFERAMDRTVGWLQREMTAPEGYFYAAQDADSFPSPNAPEPEEGAFYVWRYQELAERLSPSELMALTEAFTVTEAGNFEGTNVLQRRQPGELSAIAEAALDQLFVARYGQPSTQCSVFPPARSNAAACQGQWPGRIPAVTDTKMIVAWNSLMISGLAQAAVAWQRPEIWYQAAKAAQFIIIHQWAPVATATTAPAKRLHRLNYEGEPQVLAQSEDYALLIKALLDLQQSALNLLISAEEQILDWQAEAVRVQSEFDQHLWSEEGGYYNTERRADLLILERSYDDHATPSANGMAIANLVRLSALTGKMNYLNRAEQALSAFSTVLQITPQRCPSLFVAWDWLLHFAQVRAEEGVLGALSWGYGPTLMLQAIQPPSGTVGFICTGLSCGNPLETLEDLQTSLHQTDGLFLSMK